MSDNKIQPEAGDIWFGNYTDVLGEFYQDALMHYAPNEYWGKDRGWWTLGFKEKIPTEGVMPLLLVARDGKPATRLVLEQVAGEMENEIRPELDHSGAYNCCGCDTYEQILDHAIKIVRRQIEEAP